jgi:hypothetical protein
MVEEMLRPSASAISEIILAADAVGVTRHSLLRSTGFDMGRFLSMGRVPGNAKTRQMAGSVGYPAIKNPARRPGAFLDDKNHITLFARLSQVST